MKEIIKNYEHCLNKDCGECSMNSRDCEQELARLMLGAVNMLEAKVKQLEIENKELRSKARFKRHCK